MRVVIACRTVASISNYNMHPNHNLMSSTLTHMLGHNKRPTVTAPKVPSGSRSVSSDAENRPDKPSLGKNPHKTEKETCGEVFATSTNTDTQMSQAKQ